MKIIAGLALVLLAQWAFAACPAHALSDPAQLRLGDKDVLIVTHASSTYDARLVTKRGVDEVVRFARNHRIPVVYPQDDTPEKFYFMEDCNPDYWVASTGGEIGFDVTPRHVYIAGGHLELCLSRTVNDVIYSWARQGRRDLAITFVMDAIYSNGKSFEETDRYYNDFLKFMSIVTHGRPQGEHWPKLTLLEIMGIIIKEEHELDYLKKLLPRYDRTMPADFRVQITLNDSMPKILQPGRGFRPPTLRFEFVDSTVDMQ